MHIHDIIEQFRAAMAQAGLKFTGEIKPDAQKIQRFSVDEDRRSALTGWYILYTDGIPAGEFGCWKRGIQSTWCAKSPAEITPAEREAIEQRRRKNEEDRRAIQDEAHKAAAELAGIMWDAAEPCTTHPYLTRKGIQSHGLRTATWRKTTPNGEVVVENALLVPVRDGRKIVSLQAILPSREPALDRDKDFLPGGKKRGCFYPIGKPAEDDQQPTIYIGEGYATCASIHEATGCPAIVAFDAGNLPSVAERIRAKFPTAKIVIAADNDRWTVPTPDKPNTIENPGVHYATRAAREIGAALVIPDFKNLDSKPTDFNDLHNLEGIEAVRQFLSPQPANDNVPAERPATPPAAIDWFSPFPDINGKGKPIATIENIEEARRRLGVVVRYNVIRKDLELLIPNASFSIDNKANASLAWFESACNRFQIPVGSLQGFLGYLGDQNQYNPVAVWIQSKPWDGISRLRDFYNTIHADGETHDERILELKIAMMQRWMISAVAAVFRPTGVSAHGVLVLQGDQYLGKTKWFKSLAPADLGVIADGLTLRPDDKDSVKTVLSNWIVELGELDATFRKSDIAQLKSFLTRDRDSLRRPYAKLESEYARRTVFFASVNPRQFLHDPTGNRRYWTISCKSIDHDHALDMQQIWAEVYETLYLKGETWFLSPTEMAMLNDQNKTHEVLDPIRERLQTRMDWEAHESMWRWMTATDIMNELGFDRPTRSDVTQAGQIVQELNGGQHRRSNGKSQARVPPPISQHF
ncbi:MAG: toprim domain-containing protein [Oxalobacteraceae bacterium]|jgi:putative DNA primase/helicase|nr:toprim domain-containing protein [Oxalobacteraceae bacterium]